jgi:hypothetical protein
VADERLADEGGEQDRAEDQRQAVVADEPHWPRIPIANA